MLSQPITTFCSSSEFSPSLLAGSFFSSSYWLLSITSFTGSASTTSFTGLPLPSNRTFGHLNLSFSKYRATNGFTVKDSGFSQFPHLQFMQNKVEHSWHSFGFLAI